MNWLERQIRARPNAIAVSFASEGSSWTYAELGERVSRTAAALQAAGVRPGSRVATLMGNTPFHLLTIHATAWVGATLVPINTRLTDREISWLLDDAKADLLVFDHEAQERELDLGVTRFVQVEDLTRSLRAEPRPVDRDTMATLIYTSGTTGLPKPVPLTWANHAASAAASAYNLGLQHEDNWLCVLPLYHIGGLSIVYRSVIYGTALTLMDGFDVDAVGDFIAGGEVTLASLVPTMLRRLWRHEGRSPELLALEVDKGRLRAVLLGGGPADEASLLLCAEHGLPVYQTYGMTEACSQITTMPSTRALEKIGSAGISVFGATFEVRQDETRCAPGEIGTIFIRGPMVTKGYLDRPAENERRFSNGWFDTGDLGRVDDDGFLSIVTRRNDLIVSGGENVYPAEIESVLRGHPAVSDIGVFGVRDDEWGQVVAAAIVPNGDVDEAVIEAFARELLGGYKIPRRMIFVDELPRTASGKLRRSELGKLLP